ncbi:MAG: hypothetical protein ACKO96_20350 [Flammeovirgaceae bacterium]
MKMLKAIVNLFRFDKTNWRAALLCMLAALVFWFFNALNKNYSANIKFPIRFDYSVEKFAPVQAPPQRVTLNVNGTGWEIFREYFGFKQPELAISLEHPTEIKKLAGISLAPLLQHQLGKLKINFVVTDTLTLHFDEISSHRFKLFADLSDVSYQENFGRVSPVVILPDSVELTGPRSVLKALPDSLPLIVSATQLEQNFENDIEVLVPSAYIKRNPPQANVLFEVGRVQQQIINVKVVLQKGFVPSATTWYDSIKCRFNIPEKRLEDFHRHKNEMQLLWDSRQMILMNKPSFVELIRIDTLASSTQP